MPSRRDCPRFELADRDQVLVEQPELSIPDEEVEPTAELLRSAMAGLALWWLDHPEVPRPVLVDLVTRTIRGLLGSSR
jgi:hypothetical protein